MSTIITPTLDVVPNGAPFELDLEGLFAARQSVVDLMCEPAGPCESVQIDDGTLGELPYGMRLRGKHPYR
jgi:hypothetical protein